MKVVSIDPSVREVGWAVVDGLTRDAEGVWDDTNADWRYGMWKIYSHSLQNKLQEIVEHMILTFDGLDPDAGDILVVEWPAFFDNQRGHVASKQGFTINLAAVCAFVAGYFRMPWQQWHPLTAFAWKGNISKEITRKRFFNHLGIKQIYKIDHNAVDAVMMLLQFCRDKRICQKIVSKTMDYLGECFD